MTLPEKLTHLFKKQFGTPPTHYYQAPGRVNLIGEHTDYNDGFVLPCAINYQTVVAACPRADNQVVVMAADYNGAISQFDLTQEIVLDKAEPWSNYVRGMAWVLQQQGHTLHGANLAIASNVPPAAGLSSSAALELSVGTAFKHLNDLSLDGQAIALAGQQVENHFVGVNSGIMDQFISALGQEGHALLIDCRSLTYQAVQMPTDVAVIIVNSHVKRGKSGLLDSQYNTRRQQCEIAARHFNVAALRDLSLDRLTQQAHELDDTVVKRAKHVISENNRTQAAANALAVGDLPRMGRLMVESHASMRDDFEITVPPIDGLVELIQRVIGHEGGVRMTGGGFGGCVVALAPQAFVPAVEAAVKEKYAQLSGGIEATLYICQASAGASRLLSSQCLQDTP